MLGCQLLGFWLKKLSKKFKPLERSTPGSPVWISIVDISTLLKNIDIDMVIFENIDIDKVILKNIDIRLIRSLSRNIDIDKERAQREKRDYVGKIPKMILMC